MDLRYQKKGTPTGRALYPHFVTRRRSHPESKYTDYNDWYQRWTIALKELPLGKHPIREASITSHVSVTLDE